MNRIKFIIILFLLVRVNYGQDSLNCRLLTTTGDLVDAYALTVKGDSVFSGFFSQLHILDMADIYNPILLYSDSVYADTVVKEINSIAIQNNLAYLACCNGLVIMDISSPETPIVLSQLVTQEYLQEIIIHNNTAYVGTLDYSFLVFDVSDSENPVEIGRVDENIDDVWGLEIWNGYLLVASEDTGGKIYDISNPSTPNLLSTMLVLHNTTTGDISAKNNVAYLSNPTYIYTYDISDIENPVQLDSLNMGGTGNTIAIEEDYLYCLGCKELIVIDISESTNMKIVGIYPLPSTGADLYVKDKIVYISCQTSGIYVIQFTEPVSVNEKKNVINKFLLNQNYPNPFNSSTTITYKLPIDSDVELNIYNISGQKISTLISEKQIAGNHSVKLDASNFVSGIYFYHLETDKGFSESRKLILLK